MRLNPPGKAPQLTLKDVYGEPVQIGGANGRRTLLCFFRDASCPFCNFRIYELTQRHKKFSSLGLDIVAVFAATPESVRRFVAQRPRPFPVVVDSDSISYGVYGIERSFLRKYKGIVTRIPTLIKGLRIVGLAGLNTTNLMPADFLIDEEGRIVEAWYGGDAGDRIPLGRVELFVANGVFKRAGERSLNGGDVARRGLGA